MKQRAMLNRGNFRVLASSGLSSLSNAGAVLVAASILGPVEYGRFSLVVMLVLLVSVAVNAFTGEVLLSIAPSPAERRRAYTTTCSLALIASILLAVLLVAFGTRWNSAAACVIAGVSVTLHAGLRSGAFARMEPGDALRLDGIWVGILAASFSLLIWLEPAIEPTSVTLTLIWCSGALVGVLFSSDRYLMLPLRPVRHTRQWLRSHGKFGLSLAYGVITDAGARNVVVTALAPVAGLAQLGGFRFTQSALGLSTIVFSAARAQTLAVLSRRKRVGSPVSLAIVSLALCLIPILASAVLMTMMPVLGRIVDPQILDVARSLIWPIALLNIGSAISQGPQIGLRLRSDASMIVFARTASGLALLIAGLVLLHTFGLIGAAWGMAGGRMIGAMVWWTCLIVRDRSIPTV